MVKEKISRPGSSIYWKGCVTGPDFGPYVLTHFLILTPITVFFVFSAERITAALTVAPLVLLLWLLGVALSSLSFAAFTDPGIIPRASPEEDDYALADHVVTPARVQVNGKQCYMKYCSTCRMFRPPRTAHCAECDNCVAHFDHHCPYIGNCIGLRNYRFFVVFVTSTTCLCVYLFLLALCDLYLVSEDRTRRGQNAIDGKNGFIGAASDAPSSAVVLLYTFLLVWSVGGLSTFHCWLTSIDQTTNESIKSEANVYNRGCGRNWLSRLFLVHPSAFAPPDTDARARRRSVVVYEESACSASSGVSARVSDDRPDATADVASEAELVRQPAPAPERAAGHVLASSLPAEHSRLISDGGPLRGEVRSHSLVEGKRRHTASLSDDEASLLTQDQ